MDAGAQRQQWVEVAAIGAGDLMPLETPLLRVSRPVAACSRCRSAKIKCDGKLPACTACERANRAQECSSTNDQFAKGKERSYVATLEARVERLEKKIAEGRARRRSSVTMLDGDVATPRRLSVDTNGKPKDRKAARRKELSDIDELVSDFGFLAVNATARDFFGFTSAMSYARLILAASSKEALPTGMKKDLPPRHTASALIEDYLRHIQAIVPVLDAASFYTSFDNVYSPDTRKAGPYDHWNVRMVLAISSAGHAQQRGDAHYSDAIGHICAALEHAEFVLHPGSIWSIQAMLLLVLYAMYDPHHFDSWTLIGATARAMVDIGLHQDPHKTSSTNKAKLELRRRVYYCVFTLDRSTSMVQTRTFSFSDDSAHVALPFATKTASTPSTSDQSASLWMLPYEPALDVFKLRVIQSTWYTQMFSSGRSAWKDPYSYIWKAYHEMQNWYNNLSQSITPGVRMYLELELLYSHVYLLSPNLRCLDISAHAQRLIFEHCISFAGKVLHLTNESTSDHFPLTFHDALRVYMTGRYFIDVVAKYQDDLLQPSMSTPTSAFSPRSTDTEVDPMAQVFDDGAPPIPTPILPNGSNSSDSTPAHRAVSAISDFISVLSYFGVRFGYVSGISWRDRFQRESQPLLTQLQQRIQRQKQAEQGFPLWNQQQASMAQLSPSSGNPAFYPSPPHSHYSPEYQTPHNERSGSGGWNAPISMSEMGMPMPIPPTTMGDMSGSHMMIPPLTIDDLGLSQLTAWETLPGGSLNARFS